MSKEKKKPNLGPGDDAEEELDAPSAPPGRRLGVVGDAEERGEEGETRLCQHRPHRDHRHADPLVRDLRTLRHR